MPKISYKYPATDKDTTLRADSMTFPDNIVYEFRADSIIIYTRKNGLLAVHRRYLRALAEELLDIADTWEGVRT